MPSRKRKRPAVELSQAGPEEINFRRRLNADARAARLAGTENGPSLRCEWTSWIRLSLRLLLLLLLLNLCDAHRQSGSSTRQPLQDISDRQASHRQTDQLSDKPGLTNHFREDEVFDVIR